MGRQPCCEKSGLKRGPWTIEEDHKLMNFILNNGIQCWRVVPKLAGLLRCGKSCRLRWINYPRPDLKRGALTEAEEDMIIQLHTRLGNSFTFCWWSKIAAHFPGRTDNEIKNHWNTRIKKKLKLLGLDPLTHKPIEQHENCESEREVLHQPSSSLEHGIGNMVLEFWDNKVFQDHQKISDSKGTCNNSEEIKLAHISKMPARLDVGSILSQKTHTIFSGGMDIEDNLGQCWVNSPMSWNVLNHLEHDIVWERKSAEH